MRPLPKSAALSPKAPFAKGSRPREARSEGSGPIFLTLSHFAWSIKEVSPTDSIRSPLCPPFRKRGLTWALFAATCDDNKKGCAARRQPPCSDDLQAAMAIKKAARPVPLGRSAVCVSCSDISTFVRISQSRRKPAPRLPLRRFRAKTVTLAYATLASSRPSR